MSRRPVIVIVAAIVVAEALLVLTDTGPNVWLVAAIVAAIGTATWFGISLGDRIARPSPPPRPLERTTTRPDLRTTALRQALAAGDTNARHAERIRRQLVDIVDDELAAVHGIDRAHDPDAARELLGPDLDRFVTDPDTATALIPRRLDHIVTLIERI